MAELLDHDRQEGRSDNLIVLGHNPSRSGFHWNASAIRVNPCGDRFDNLRDY